MSRQSRRRDVQEEQDEDSLKVEPPIKGSERLLVERVTAFPEGRLLCNSLGWGQLARTFSNLGGNRHAVCWFLDLYRRNRAVAAARHWASATLEEAGQPKQATEDPLVNHAALLSQGAVDYVCTPDPPAGPYDVVAWALSHRGEAELAREYLQLAQQHLQEGGVLFCGIDNPHDRWLHQILLDSFDRVSRDADERGVVYRAYKTRQPSKIKSYWAEFAFRDQGKLIYAYSRPGVFSHRHIDPGARALLLSMKLPARGHVLDLGCGSGVVSLAALTRSRTLQVFAVDANPRAIECALKGRERNQLPAFEAVLDANGHTIPPGRFHVVCANPPYYSQWRIADLFLQIARGALRPDGQLFLVTKTADWYREHLPEYFQQAEEMAVRQYIVFRAERPRLKRRP
ncbi:MAG: SAM-dependent methyltransferase [Planctomycetaceae bacterium]|nr:MAG: SAM-dependent methyltransferase [Planctomycetaceae bacterium]